MRLINDNCKPPVGGIINFIIDIRKFLNCCYNDLGDTIYVSQVNNGAVSGTPISYEETIIVSDYQQQLTASRINYKTYKSVWNTEYRLPFEIFPDTKKEYVLLDNSTNIWKITN